MTRSLSAGSCLVLLLALASWGHASLNDPVFSPVLGPPLVLAALGLLFWSYFNLGRWCGAWLARRFGGFTDEPAILTALGMMASIGIFLLLGLLGLLGVWSSFLVFALVLLASGSRLASALTSLRSRWSGDGTGKVPWVGLGLTAAIVLLAGLFSDVAWRGEFQSDAIDAFTVYLPELRSHLQTGDLARPYFLFQAHVFPWLYSSLLYLPVLALGSVHSLPAFSLAAVALGGVIIFSLTRRLAGNAAGLLAVAFFFLSYFWIYYNDLGLNLLKYNHFLSLILSLVALYCLLEFMAEGRRSLVLLLGAATGMMVAEFSLAFPPTLLWLACCLAFPPVWRRFAAAPGRILLAFALPAAAVVIIPFALNYFFTGIPADPAMVPTLLQWFSPQPEFWSTIFYGGQHAYPTPYSSKTEIGDTVYKLARFFLIPWAGALALLVAGKYRRRGWPIVLLIVLSFGWLCVIQHYISPKIRYQFWTLPLLAIACGVLLDYLSDLVQKILRSRVVAGLVALAVVALAGLWANNLTPPVLLLHLTADKGLWLLKDYQVHHQVVAGYRNNAVQSYIKKHVRKTEKILVPQLGFLNYTLDRIVLNSGTLPYHAMYLSDPEYMLSTLRKLHVNYLLLVEGKRVTGPYRPLLLEPDFAAKHLRLVAASPIRRYLFNDQLYAYREDRKKILDPRHVEKAYLFKISSAPLRQTPQEAARVRDIVGEVKMWDTYTPAMDKALRQYPYDDELIQRLNAFDAKWGGGSPSRGN